MRRKEGQMPSWLRPERSDLERAVESALRCSMPGLRVTHFEKETARRLLRYDTGSIRVVVLGGGTGMSTVVGGNSQMPDWMERPSIGLKSEFPRLDVVVCTTDDGGSTGELLKHLPMIGIGDLRKSCLSMIDIKALRQLYRLSEFQAQDAMGVIQKVVNHRFPSDRADIRMLENPLLAVPPDQRALCPSALRRTWTRLGVYAAASRGLNLDPAGHCLGNLLLTASVFMAAGRKTSSFPSGAALRKGIDRFARAIGSPAGCLHPATATPGQLRFRYANGVEVTGQSKSSTARRGFPVEGVRADFIARPSVAPAVIKALRSADLIVFAPGSLYTSIIPVLQVPSIADAIRSNRKALKILGANFWAQEGETDLSFRNDGREFLVSELIEAYARNVPGGVEGLFHIILCDNLEHIPGHVLRNYALEGKKPIHLDRTRVEAMGFQPVEASLFSIEHLRYNRVLHHDAAKFALAVRALLYAVRDRRPAPVAGPLGEPAPMAGAGFSMSRPLCDDYAALGRILAGKAFEPASLRETLEALVWANRDIRPEHLRAFKGARILRSARWNRSTDWDNVLGYYEPKDGWLNLHEDLTAQPERLKEDLLIALGESLLGNYIERRRWIDSDSARCYEIRLRPASRRRGCLDDRQLRLYLSLARMIPDEHDPLVFRLTLNNHEGFLPSGLLFGLLYAWYLNNAYGGAMEYEMSLLRWPTTTLMPHQAQDRIRKQALVSFFRREVFRRL